MPPTESRKVFNYLTDIFLPYTDVAGVSNHRSPDEIPFRIYDPVDTLSDPLPTVLCIHDGGWVI